LFKLLKMDFIQVSIIQDITCEPIRLKDVIKKVTILTLNLFGTKYNT
jgi:hypothetical protein